MQNSEATQYESAANELIEDINQLESIALGAGAGTCQVCGERIPEGSPIAVCAFRLAGASHWRVGQSKCDDDRPQATEDFTLGVRELLVDGRVGCVSDQATQSYWPVLLAPRVRAISPESTTDVFDVRWLPPHVRESRLARTGDPTPAKLPEPTPTEPNPAITQDPQTERTPDDDAEPEPASDPGQRTLDDLAADLMEEDA
ncbi:hypothetical protein ACERIT_06815 [Halopenitus sp. H-Gu1]|uniref:hypothetical protein n=1 Tax=Halopenitus sp. H-Gu1 TaxID=3242697 RepID=UPI00359D8FE4